MASYLVDRDGNYILDRAGNRIRLDPNKGIDVDVTFHDDVTMDSFKLSSGTVDFNGQAITVTGDFTILDGAAVLARGLVGSAIVVGGILRIPALDLAASGAWTLSVAGSAIASGVGDVAYCDASGGTQIEAGAGPWTDSGNNTNWNFGIIAPSLAGLSGLTGLCIMDHV